MAKVGEDMDRYSKKSIGPKMRRKLELENLMKSLDIEGLLDHFDRISGDMQMMWSMEGLRDIALDQVIAFGDDLVTNSRNPEKDGILWYHLPNELAMRAMVKDYRRFVRIQTKFPIQSYAKSSINLARKYGESVPSFADDHDSAEDYFHSIFEIYRKVVLMLANMASIAVGNSDITPRDSIGYLKTVESGRYCALTLSDIDRAVRNAIAHSDFFLDESNKFDFPMNARRCQRTAGFLDDRVKLMSNRMAVVSHSLALAQVMACQVVITAMRSIRARSETSA